MKNVVFATLLAAAAFAVHAEGQNGQHSDHARKLRGCEDCGTVQAVIKEKRKGEGGAVGIVAGGVAGGLLGNQFGKGNGKTLATVGGAVAGGFAGNEVQKHVTSKEVWVTKVKLKDGSTRSFEQAKQPAWKSGEVVKVQKNTLVAL
jgi:outer membrane lipoprotein SlyB